MPVDDEYLDYLKDLLDWVPGLRAKRMFGGIGLYSDSGIFAIVDQSSLYLKADDHNLDLYRDNGAEQFTYQSGGKTRRMNYWSVPAAVLEDAGQLENWVRSAMDAAIRAKN